MKADKPKVVDEVWDDERVRSFLARDGVSAAQGGSYHILARAYQGMRANDFRRFVAEYAAVGGNLDATDARGQTLADHVVEHRHGSEYLEVLLAAGARPPQPRAVTGTG